MRAFAGCMRSSYAEARRSTGLTIGNQLTILPAVTKIRRKTVTLTELAERLGLSLAAVSRALNNRPSTIRVSEETTRRVKAMAAELGYRPNSVARALRTGESDAIAVIVASGLDHLKSLYIYHALRQVEACGKIPVIHEVSAHHPGSVEHAVQQVIDSNTAGVVALSLRAPQLKWLTDSGVPTVVVANPEQRGFPRFCPDGVQGMHDLTRHLIDQGSRDIVLLDIRGDEKARKRSEWSIENGFDDAIAAANRQGLGVSGEISVSTVIFDGLYSPEAPQIHGLHAGGYLGMKRLLANRQRPDGVIGINDATAQGALAACAEAGVSVPGDILIAGFGDTPAASVGTVPLTSIAKPLPTILKRAFEVLGELMEKKTVGGDFVELVPCELVVRRSTTR